MPHLNRDRLRKLEARLGVVLPGDFVTTLEQRDLVRQRNVAIVTPQRVWDVHTFFCLDDSRNSGDQLDELYDLVGDVLPPGALPFAADLGGNFYCLMLSGPARGSVAYWDHEREVDDDRVEPVCGSISEFYARLSQRPPDAG